MGFVEDGSALGHKRTRQRVLLIFQAEADVHDVGVAFKLRL